MNKTGGRIPAHALKSQCSSLFVCLLIFKVVLDSVGCASSNLRRPLRLRCCQKIISKCAPSTHTRTCDLKPWEFLFWNSWKQLCALDRRRLNGVGGGAADIWFGEYFEVKVGSRRSLSFCDMRVRVCVCLTMYALSERCLSPVPPLFLYKWFKV